MLGSELIGVKGCSRIVTDVLTVGSKVNGLSMSHSCQRNAMLAKVALLLDALDATYALPTRLTLTSVAAL